MRYKCVSKNGSFTKLWLRFSLYGFANVPFVQRQNFIFLCCGEKIKHNGLGNECNLTLCRFIVLFQCPCSLFKIVYFFSGFNRLFVVVMSSFMLTDNVLHLGDLAKIEAQMFNVCKMFNRIPNVQFSTEPAVLPN